MKHIVLSAIVSVLSAGTASGGMMSVRESAETESWEAITLQAVSSDRKAASYFVVKKNSREGELRLINIETGKSRTVGDGSDGVFSPDGRWFARATRVGGAVLIDVSTGREFTYPCGSKLIFSPSSRYLTLASGSPRGNSACPGQIQGIELSTLSVSTIPEVVEYSFSPDRTHVAYVSQNGSERSVKILDVESQIKPSSLFSSKSKIQALTWNEDGSALAFLDSFEIDEGVESFVVHLYDGTALRSFDHRQLQSFASGSLVGRNNLRVTKDGSTILFELKSAEHPVSAGPVAASLVQVWHSRDIRVVSEDIKNSKPTRIAAWNYDRERFSDLSVGGRQFATLSGDGTRAITYIDNRPGPVIQYGYGVESDVILASTDLRTGETRVVQSDFPMEHVKKLMPSPNGRFLAYFRDKHWWIYDFETGGHVNVSVGMNVALHDAEEDRSIYLVPYGSPGWTDDGRLVVYDKYDIWFVPTNGLNPQKITMGLKERKVHRFLVEESQPLNPGGRPTRSGQGKTFARYDTHVLTLFGEINKKSGFATYSNAKGVVELKYDDVYVSNIFSAPDHRSFVYQEERFDSPPQLVAQDVDAGERKVFARSNAHFDRSTWGAAATIEYKDARGRSMQGILFSPAGYRKGTKYPLIVSIYERQSNGLHEFRYPIPSDYLSVSSFTNDGYYVLLPDIRYGGNSPGIDAVGAVTAAVSEVLKRGDVNARSVGITGASWGGYQTAFIITQSNMFAAAVAGSAPTDLVSWYLSNETGSGGTPTMWRFELDQIRIRTPLHENGTEYLRNSPVMHAGSVNTPLLSWFGGKDPIISTSQPIEMYNALRRAGKEHILLLYPDEGHVLASSQAVLDLDVRVRQWFDHYLKGVPAAAWIEQGESGQVMTR